MLPYGFKPEVVCIDELLEKSVDTHGESGRIDCSLERVRTTQLLFWMMMMMMIILFKVIYVLTEPPEGHLQHKYIKGRRVNNI